MKLEKLPPIVRTFIALDTPAELKEVIAKLQRDLSRIPGAKVTWPKMDGIHLTLKFLGDVEGKQIPALIGAMQDCVKPFRPTELKTTHTGGFPNLQRPRVLWLGLESTTELMSLQSIVEKTCFEFGFPLEEKAFHPHLTVGRVKEIERGCALNEQFERAQIKPIIWTVSNIKIMSSELRQSGAIYEVLGTASFN